MDIRYLAFTLYETWSHCRILKKLSGTTFLRERSGYCDEEYLRESRVKAERKIKKLLQQVR